jgi:hypothetical protein
MPLSYPSTITVPGGYVCDEQSFGWSVEIPGENSDGQAVIYGGPQNPVESSGDPLPEGQELVEIYFQPADSDNSFDCFYLYDGVGAVLVNDPSIYGYENSIDGETPWPSFKFSDGSTPYVPAGLPPGYAETYTLPDGSVVTWTEYEWGGEWENADASAGIYIDPVSTAAGQYNLGPGIPQTWVPVGPVLYFGAGANATATDFSFYDESYTYDGNHNVWGHWNGSAWEYYGQTGGDWPVLGDYVLPSQYDSWLTVTLASMEGDQSGGGPPSGYSTTLTVTGYGDLTWNEGGAYWSATIGDNYLTATIGANAPSELPLTLMIEIDFPTASFYAFYDPDTGEFIEKFYQDGPETNPGGGPDNLQGPAWTSGDMSSTGEAPTGPTGPSYWPPAADDDLDQAELTREKGFKAEEGFTPRNGFRRRNGFTKANGF